MEEESIDTVEQAIQLIDKLDYIEKQKVYSRLFGLGCMGDESLDTKIVLISLIAITWFKLKEKNSKITPLEILIKITGETKDTIKGPSFYYKVLENLSILTEDLCYGHKTASTCGLKSSQEIITKIKETLNTWTPF